MNRHDAKIAEKNQVDLAADKRDYTQIIQFMNRRDAERIKYWLFNSNYVVPEGRGKYIPGYTAIQTQI